MRRQFTKAGESGTGKQKIQLELVGTQPEDRLDKKICPWDAIRIYEFNDATERSKYFYEPNAARCRGVYVTNAVEKRRLEEKQLELYEINE